MMKTNVIMKSVDRNLFGVTIKQQTKGTFLSVSDLTKSYEKARFIHGWGEKNLTMIMQTKDFKERCYYLLFERGLIKLSILSFMEMVEREGIVKVLKGLDIWAVKGRGDNKSVYCDPYVWVLLAMELNPMIYAKVVVWLTDSLIFDRVLAGSEFRPMNSAISMIVQSPNYPVYSREINNKVFGKHESGIRNIASAEQLRKVADIEKFITQSIHMGLCRSEQGVLKIIQNYR